jgi:hypothetical protein
MRKLVRSFGTKNNNDVRDGRTTVKDQIDTRDVSDPVMLNILDNNTNLEEESSSTCLNSTTLLKGILILNRR